MSEEKELKEQRDTLYDELDAIRYIFKAAIHNHRKPKGGQQVMYHGDFANVTPSSIREMEWWAKRWDNVLNTKEFESLKNEIK